MKLFHTAKRSFTFSCFQLDRIPVASDPETAQGSPLELARTLCEDGCYLSANGSSQIAIEVLRLAGDTPGDPIVHLIALRCQDRSEDSCVTRHRACVGGMTSALHLHGYRFHELPFEEYVRRGQLQSTSSVWAIKKAALREHGIQVTYTSVPIVDRVDWDAVYAALDGSGCALAVQIIPSLATGQERALIVQNHRKCCQASTGAITNLRDPMAAPAETRWSYFSQRQHAPMAHVSLVVRGQAAKAALVAARIRQAIHDSALRIVPIQGYDRLAIYDRPWRISLLLNQTEPAPLEKWTSEEAAHVLALPLQGTAFTGLDVNPFSHLPESDLLPTALTGTGAGRIRLGSTVMTGQPISIADRDFLLHTGIFGKPGVGKTTLLKQLVRQFSAQNIPVLILEPVKREYRSLMARARSTRVFTVESPVVPLLLNPFRVPNGVTLGGYRSSLLSAFKAAFSMPDPLPALFEKAISEAYLLHGWTDRSRSDDPDVEVFDMAQFIRVFRKVILSSSYSGEVKGNMMAGGAFRLQSLIERCPWTFDSCTSTDVTHLLTGQVVLEMGMLEPEQRILVSTLVLISILAYLKATRESAHALRNIILIDEAHALLDQGGGQTVEEKALSGAIEQLLIDLIAEIRAYGVGIIFSDQSPSRIGSRLMDNVDNLLSFRLSGEEAALLQSRVGDDGSLTQCLPLLNTGELVLSNYHLRRPLALRMNFKQGDGEGTTVSDGQVAQWQRDYLAAQRENYRPYAQCRLTPCRGCSVRVRAQARKYSTQIFSARRKQLDGGAALAAHILRLPQALSAQGGEGATADFPRLCRCTAIHLARKCALEAEILLADHALSVLLTEMERQSNSPKEEHHG